MNTIHFERIVFDMGALLLLMAYFAYKRSGKNRYLVIRWKKRINGIPTIDYSYKPPMKISMPIDLSSFHVSN